MHPPVVRRPISLSDLRHLALVERLRLYLVADPDHIDGDPAVLVREAISGGVTAVQLRCKGRTDRTYLELAISLNEICSSLGALFVVNDRVDIALASGAAGVHLGVDDFPIKAARMLGGPDFVIGFSPETDKNVQTATEDGASYLGVGPVFGTATKDDAGLAIGLETIARRAELASIPIIGIGGINESNARSVIHAGAVGVAVVSAITRAADPAQSSRILRESLDS